MGEAYLECPEEYEGPLTCKQVDELGYADGTVVYEKPDLNPRPNGR